MQKDRNEIKIYRNDENELVIEEFHFEQKYILVDPLAELIEQVRKSIKVIYTIHHYYHESQEFHYIARYEYDQDLGTSIGKSVDND